jgi:hypothetical protein
MVGFLYSRTRLLSASLLFISLSILAGCGGGPGDKNGSVEGLVKIDGSLANSGNVVFKVGDMKVSGRIEPDGKYKVIGVPVGDADVTVIPATPVAAPVTPNKDMTTMKDMPAGPPVVSKPVPIPAKYKTEAGGLKFKVKSGQNKWDIDLTK